MKLHPLNHANGRNRYCGPAVISFATGLSTADAAKLIRDRYNRRSITGTHTREVRYVLERAGIRMLRKSVEGKPTLAGWLKGTQEIRTEGRVFLLVAGNHWQLVSGRRYACGQVGEIVSTKHAQVKRRARVTEVYELIEMSDHKERLKNLKGRMHAEAEFQKAERATRAKAQRDVKKAAKQHGIEIDVDRFESGKFIIYFMPPAEIEQARIDGEIDFIGVAYDWEEAPEVLGHIITAINDWKGAA